MDADELRRAIRNSRGLILLVVFVCTAAAVAYTRFSEPRYESETQLFVAAQARDFSEQRAPSYAGLAVSPNIIAPVISELGLKDTPRELRDRISASTPPDTVLIDLTVSDSDPARAQRTGQAVARQLIELVTQLEKPNSASRKPAVRLVVSSPANLPSDPVSPDARINVPAGIVLGLLLGLLAAVARGRLDRRILDLDDLPPVLREGLLGAVPFDPSAGEAPAAGLRGTSPERAEALRRLRANVRFVDRARPPRSVVVTSTLPGEGASTTALGLARAMADAGTDVVLVEADLRRPHLAGLLGLSRNAGLSGYLAGSAPLEPLLQRCAGGRGDGALRVLVAGPSPPDPSELLSSRRMPALLEQLATSCDIVLIDAPPVLAVTDAAVLAAEAEGVLLVVRMGEVTVPELERALEILTGAGAGVLGLVANAVSGEEARDQRREYPAIPDPVAARTPPPALPPAVARPPIALRAAVSASRQAAAVTANPAAAPGPGRPGPGPEPSAAREAP